MTTLHPYIVRYLAQRIRRGEIGQDTLRNSRHHLFAFAQSFGNRTLGDLGPKALIRHHEQMVAQGLAPGTMSTRISTLRGFARWLVLEDTIPDVKSDFTMLAPRIRRPRVVAHDMTNEHVGIILRHVRSEREKLIVLLMFGCGLRCVEVSRLDVEDYDPASRLLYVTGKGQHSREVPVPDYVRTTMTSYLAQAGHGFGALIRYEDGTDRLGPGRISGIVGRLCRVSGVKVRRYDGRSAHGIRAASASDLHEACPNGDPTVVQEFLGHADLSNLAPYLRRASLNRVRQAQRNRPPLAS